MNPEKIYDAVSKLRKKNKSFNILVSDIDTKFEEFITKSQSKFASTGWKIPVKLLVPYKKIGTKEKSLLERYISLKYSIFGRRFTIQKSIFLKRYIIRNYI